ncbi:hypothetical protein SAMN05192575_103350 [Nocardioides alpinus]|uniref:UPF0182 protein CXG46_14640 n=1 Tax=Nocardioides alpinus TaxID=748909 RepID=A0A1I0YBT5_9ACTN|nr:UPF0182 family protein [Nocardioides alpinus]PKH38966.1 UPF0182 family protein [Nocardioides alpinus]SFB09858.1 hypothetical protein SAMN05192575_103350 [Nocardioides alpinus]
MSTPFDRPSGPAGPGGPSGPTPPRPAAASRRPGALVITGIVLVIGFMLLSGFASFWTERLWFRSVGYSGVFTTLLLTRIGLFLVFAGLMAAMVALTIAIAYRFRPLLWPGLPGMSDDGMDRYRALLGPRMGWVIGGSAVVMGLFAGASATGQWRNFSMWRHSQSFGTTDPYFNKDVGFYIFELPFWHYIVDYVMALAVVGLMASVLVNYLFGGIRLSARPGERLTSAAQIQVSALLAMFVLAKAVDYWLDRFDLVTNSGSIFTGMGYTDDKAVLPAKEILAGIAVVCALLFLANIWRRTWLLPSVGVALFALSAIILGLILPTVVQAIRVNPNVPDREGPYIQANIDATRKAYALDQVETTTVEDAPVTGGGQVDELDEATSSVPLVDPKIVSEVFEQQQQVRAYYSVNDVLDVDRYEIAGTDRAVVLGVRELDQQGIDEGDRNWSNLHTVYTHGDGVIAAYANQRPEDDESQSLNIQWAEGQEADEDALTSLSEEGVESRVYFGETSPDYSVVGKSDSGNDVELVLPSDEDEESPETTYDGTGGVPVGNLFHKLLYAMKFSEPNFVLSGRVNENSKVLYDRNPRTMVEKVAPWLTVDSDPYPVVVDGRIQWVLDGYTVTDKYPLSQRESLETMTDDALQDNDNGFQTLPTDEINYLRNSVKATVDAYDGTVTLYAWDENDPILKAWDEVFPGLLKDRADIPEALVSHLRYPEDLFKTQRYQYQRYHETSAKDWFEGSTRWVVPNEPTDKNSVRKQPPYRFFIDDDGAQRWSLTSVYVPRERETLVAYMSVNSDATDEEDYGKITVRELPDGRTDGPVQIAAALSTDETVRQELLSFTNGDAEPIFGNLLTLPIEDSFMYVQPLYTRRDSESAFPVLSFVLVSYNGRVGIGETLREAIEDSLDGVVATPDPGDPETPTETPTESPSASPSESPSASPTTPVPGGTQAQIRDLLRQAEAAFAEADAAQAAGNTVKWARLMEEGRALIEEAVRLAG